MCNWYINIHNQHRDLSFEFFLGGGSQTQSSDLHHKKTQCMLSQCLWLTSYKQDVCFTRRKMVINFYWSESKKETYLTLCIRLWKALVVKVMKRGGFTVNHRIKSKVQVGQDSNWVKNVHVQVIFHPKSIKK